MQQTTGLAAAKADIANVKAAHAAISAKADAKVLTTVGTSIAVTKALAVGAVGSKAVATKAAILMKPLIAVPAGVVSIGKTKAALVSAKVGMAKSAVAIKEAAVVKAVSAAVAAKRVAKIKAQYKATEISAVGKLATSGIKAVAAGAHAVESLVLYPRGLAAGESLGNEAIPFLLSGVLGGAASSDIFEMIGRFSPGAATLLGGLLSAVRPDGERAQELLMEQNDDQNSSVNPFYDDQNDDQSSSVNPFYDDQNSAVGPNAANTQNSANAQNIANEQMSDAKGSATIALLMGALKAAKGPGALQITTKGSSGQSSLNSLLGESDDQSSAVAPNVSDNQNSAVDPVDDGESSEDGGKPLGLLGQLLQLLPVPEEMESLDFGGALTGLLPIVVNGLGALMGGAEPGAAGLPKHLSVNLIDNLAHLVPDLF